jgi:integrase
MEPKKAISRIVRVSGVKFSSHPLRRTLAVYGDWLGVDKAQVSRILNHTLPDVTSVHYQPIEVERLREPLGRINDWMLKLASEIPTAEVIPVVRTA